MLKRPHPLLLLAIAVIAVSTSAIFVRTAEDAPAIAIAFWRCFAGALILAFAARFKGLRIDWRNAAAGVALALHFGTWITSLNMTSVAISVLLVSTTPIFVALGSRFVGDPAPSPRQWIGILLSLLGTAVIVISGSDSHGENNTLGAVLALIGAVAMAVYLMIGRRSRATSSTIAYSCVTYAIAAASLLIVCIATRSNLGNYGSETWLSLIAIVLGAQMLGHTVINSVLDKIDSTRVSSALMLEPVVAGILAAIFLNESVSAPEILGAVIVLGGVWLVIHAHKRTEITNDSDLAGPIESRRT